MGAVKALPLYNTYIHGRHHIHRELFAHYMVHITDTVTGSETTCVIYSVSLPTYAVCTANSFSTLVSV